MLGVRLGKLFRHVLQNVTSAIVTKLLRYHIVTMKRMHRRANNVAEHIGSM